MTIVPEWRSSWMLRGEVEFRYVVGIGPHGFHAGVEMRPAGGIITWSDAHHSTPESARQAAMEVQVSPKGGLSAA